MRFVYPEFLFALAALAVPIVIHLFNFRRYKRVYFSNVRFLKEIKEQTQSRSRLRHLLVLLSRLLALAFLVLAFAQPYIPGSNSDTAKGNRIVSVYIDNSFSMEAEGKNGSLLETARRKAVEIANQYAATDLFQLVTNDFAGYQQRLISRDEFVAQVSEVQLSPVSRTLGEVLSRQLDVLQPEEMHTRRLVWISDFQRSTARLGETPGTAIPRVVCIPLQAQQARNLYIDSVWFETPVRQLQAREKLFVRIRNLGTEPVENIPLRLAINGQQKALTSFSVEAGSYADSALYFTNTTAGIQQAEVSLADAQVTFDDSYFFVYPVQEQVHILALYGDNPADTASYVSRLFRNDAYFSLKNQAASRLDYSTLPRYNLVILHELPALSSGLAAELKRFVNGGGHLLVFPAPAADLPSYNAFFNAFSLPSFGQADTAKLSTNPLRLDDPFFAQVFEKNPERMDLPQVRYHYRVEKKLSAGREDLLTLQGGDPLLSKYPSGAGAVYVSTVPLHEKAGNFARHAIFVPVVLRIAERSQQAGLYAQVIGRDEVISLRNTPLKGDVPFEFRNSDGSFVIIPESRNTGAGVEVYAHGQVSVAGNYLLHYDNEPIAGSGFNYDRAESDLSCYEPEALRAVLQQAGLTEVSLFENASDEVPFSLEAVDDTVEYWKWCILLTLLCLAIEIMLLRFWKN